MVDITNYKTVWDSISSNPLAMSLIIVPMLTGIVYFGRSIPKAIWSFILGVTTTEVIVYELNSRDAYHTIEFMMSKYKFKCIISNLIFHKVRYSNRPILSAGLWTIFYGMVNGMFVMIRRSRDTENKMETGFIFYARFFTRDKLKIKRLLDNISDQIDNVKLDDTYRLLTVDRWNSDWNTRIKKKINLDTCTKQQRAVIDKIQTAIEVDGLSKFGVMLYGCPGGGKTKLIEALTSHLGLRLYYINLGQMDDKEFTSVISLVRSPSILLFEDIDCVSNTSEREKSKDTQSDNNDNKTTVVAKPAVSMSTLLNVFDGVLSLDQQIVIATTNHPDKLDKAIKRKGRFDLTVELLPIEHDEICHIVSSYFKIPVKDIVAVNNNKLFDPLPVANIYAACKISDDIHEFCQAINENNPEIINL